jgi:hypothetical protein
MRPKNKVYAQGDKALSDRVRSRSKQRPRTDEERAIRKRSRDARHDAMVKMAVVKGPNTEKPTTQKYFEDFGV